MKIEVDTWLIYDTIGDFWKSNLYELTLTQFIMFIFIIIVIIRASSIA
jgi:hypothetical protein